MKNCFKCSNPIQDEFVQFVQVGTSTRFYHATCLNCSDCSQPLESSCFCKNGELYCKNDYLKTVGVECETCKEAITTDNMAFNLQSRLFHQNCLKCTVCGQQLKAGQQFDLNRPALCHNHMETSEDSEDNTESKEEAENKENSAKKRTPRTKFTESQTSILVQFFTMQTNRPNRLMREELARKTGLDIRCIQIWFQNKRSKDKRMTAKREALAAASSGGLNWFHYNQNNLVNPTQIVSPTTPDTCQTLYPTPPPNDYNSAEYFPACGVTQPPSFEAVSFMQHSDYPSPPWSGPEY